MYVLTVNQRDKPHSKGINVTFCASTTKKTGTEPLRLDNWNRVAQMKRARESTTNKE